MLNLCFIVYVAVEYQDLQVEDNDVLMYVEEEDKENQSMPLRRSMSVGALNLVTYDEVDDHEIENMHTMEENLR